MTQKLYADGIGGYGMTAKTFAQLHGIRVGCIEHYCRTGKIIGAKIHPITKGWWIYAPAKLLCVPSPKNVNTSDLMNSTWLAEKRA